MSSNKVNNNFKTFLLPNLETVQLRYKTKDLGINPLKYINKEVKAVYARAKNSLAQASKDAVNPVNSSLIKRYLAAIAR